MKKRILAAILAAAMTVSAVPTLLPAADISVSAAKSEKLPAPKNVKVSKKTDSSVTLKWSEVEGADKYAVYQYDSKTKKYTKIKSVSKTSCKVTGLDSDTKYSFKVAALVKGKDGKYTAQTQSDAKSVTTEEYPAFVMPKYGAKREDVLKSMGGKSRFMKNPDREGDDAYMSTVLYRGRETVCVLIFDEKKRFKGCCMFYTVDSKAEYNKIRDEYDKKYGDPIEGNVDTTGENRVWMDANAKKKEVSGVMLIYAAQTKDVTEAFVYVYDNTGDIFEGIAA